VTIPRTPTDELAYQIEKSLLAIERHLSLTDAEPFLEELLVEVASNRENRQEYERLFEALALVLPRGATEILEFSYRTLQWQEFRTYILTLRDRTLDWPRRRRYERILAVYESSWPDGEIYARYRDGREDS
jgi:hypothetical protein